MNWWKIVCLDCGVDADLLMDKLSRVICRECLQKHEFTEVDSIMEDDSNDGSIGQERL
jgi:hypothetical protein